MIRFPRIYLNKEQRLCLLLMLPFQVLFVLQFIWAPTPPLGSFVSNLTIFFILPVLFILLLHYWIPQRTISVFETLAPKFFGWAAIYGIVLFFYFMLTNSLFGIPYITLTGASIEGLLYKPIVRNFAGLTVTKLISSYNNGNIYGVCVLIFLPFIEYVTQNKSKLWRRIIKISLILTLSRTVWAGLILSEALKPIYLKNTITLKTILRSFVAPTLALGSIFLIMVSLFNVPPSFFLDTSLGNRLNILPDSFNILPSKEPVLIFPEIIYVGAAHFYGFISLPLFISFLAAPIIAALGLMKKKRLSLRQISLMYGLVIYCIMAAVDGAINFTPVMAFYYLNASMIIHSETT